MAEEKPQELKQVEEEAHQLIKNREFDSALSLVLDAESRNLISPAIFALHSKALTGLERWDEAWGLVMQKLEEYPGDPSLIEALAFLGNSQGFYKYTLEVCDWASKIGISSSKLAIRKSAALIGLWEDKEAADLIQQELQNYPEEVGLYRNMSAALLGMKELEKAIAVCKEAEGKGLRSGGIYGAEAIALVRLKRWSEASALIDEKLKEYPRELSLYYAKAYLNYRRWKLKAAIAVCDDARSIGVWGSGLATMKSAALLRKGEYKQATSFLNEELEKNDAPSLHYNLSLAYAASRKRRAANQERKIARELAPSLGKPLRNLRLIQIEMPVLIALYFVAGLILWPASRYYMIPLWLFLLGLSVLIGYLRARAHRIRAAVFSLVMILIIACLGFYLIFMTGNSSLDTVLNVNTPGNKSKVDQLIDDMNNSPFPSSRPSAAIELGATKDPKAIGPLIQVLEGDSDYSMRDAAACALGLIGDPAAIDSLVLGLQDSNEYVRMDAAIALGQIGDPIALEPLMGALNDSSSLVRNGAAEALGQIGDPDAVLPLMEALKDNNSYVRLTSAEALGKMGDPRAVPALNQLLKDSNPSVRAAAAEALDKINNKS